MSLEDLVVVIERLGYLEKKLLYESKGYMPSTKTWHSRKDTYGFVTMIKNVGWLVGGSLSHGHQQIGFSNVMPAQAYRNWKFLKKNKKPFSQYMMEKASERLLVKDYGVAQLIVPHFMRRPYCAMLHLKNTDRQFVHELDDSEIRAVAAGWADCTRAMIQVLKEMGRERAYNVVVHNGPGAGLYIEFLPYTQETGGFEQSGIWVCQGDPENAAAHMKEIIG